MLNLEKRAYDDDVLCVSKHVCYVLRFFFFSFLFSSRAEYLFVYVYVIPVSTRERVRRVGKFTSDKQHTYSYVQYIHVSCRIFEWIHPKIISLKMKKPIQHQISMYEMVVQQHHLSLYDIPLTHIHSQIDTIFVLFLQLSYLIHPYPFL